jgi:hypothetical protein
MVKRKAKPRTGTIHLGVSQRPLRQQAQIVQVEDSLEVRLADLGLMRSKVAVRHGRWKRPKGGDLQLIWYSIAGS